MNTKNFQPRNDIKGWSKAFFVLAIFIGFLHSCKKDDDKPDKTEHDFLIEYEKVSSITSQNVTVNFSLLMALYPELSQLNLQNTFNVDIYKVKYKTKLKGEDITASGIVCIPKNEGPFPILSFQNGTNTENAKAPSMDYNNQDLTLLLNASGLGYIVAIPDYIGFGESSEVLHPYYHRESSDAAVIDLIKACKEMLDEPAITASNNGKLFLMGYSQGGWATLSAMKTLEENNTTGLDPVAASCGAGAYNLLSVSSFILQQETYESPVYLPYFIESHRRNGFLNTSLDIYFKQPYATTIPGLFDGQHSTGTINSSLNDTISRLVTPGMIIDLASGDQYASLRNELTSNSVEAWVVKGKLLFVHGTADKTVPSLESQNIYNAFLNKGSTANVQLVLLDGLGHSTGVVPWGLKTIVWLNSLK